ncbi:hypothetical protein C0J52_18152 [Blattella germanica]|nr:hypothetical protein C0J52_18152 [Blattella germanica]
MRLLTLRLVQDAFQEISVHVTIKSTFKGYEVQSLEHAEVLGVSDSVKRIIRCMVESPAEELVCVVGSSGLDRFEAYYFCAILFYTCLRKRMVRPSGRCNTSRVPILKLKLIGAKHRFLWPLRVRVGTVKIMYSKRFFNPGFSYGERVGPKKKKNIFFRRVNLVLVIDGRVTKYLLDS